MFSAFANIFKIPELRQRVLFTLAMLAVVRIGAAITMPGVDPMVVQGYLSQTRGDGANALTTLINAFSGGATQACAIFGLGIMPYISASIMVQLLTAVVPKLSKLAREVGGRQKITQYTRYLTIILCVAQGWMLAHSLIDPTNNPLLQGMDKYLASTNQVLVPMSHQGFSYYFVSILVLTCGTLFLMWLGEQMTERGIGNGTSLIISVNILSDLPGALVATWNQFVKPGEPTKAILLVGLVILFFATVAAIIVITQAVRKIAINYAKRMIGRKMVGGQNTHLPVRLNYSGVMPIIFAQAILTFPTVIVNYVAPGSSFAGWLNELVQSNGPSHWFLYAAFIFFFAYFWVATMFQPTQISEDLKTSGGYIPGIRPGKHTAEFLDFTMNRLTFAGACFLTLVAVFPQMLNYFTNNQISPTTAQFFGGTSILILVGVLLDLMKQVETHLLQKNYDGFLQKGKIKGRYDGQGNINTGSPGGNVVWIYIVLAVLFLIGMAAWIFKTSGQ